jgi:hypothetical protein
VSLRARDDALPLLPVDTLRRWCDGDDVISAPRDSVRARGGECGDTVAQ